MVGESYLRVFSIPKGSRWPTDDAEAMAHICIDKTSYRDHGLSVVARGPNFQFFVDGSQIYSHTDRTFPSGRAGVNAWNDVDLKGAEMFFDNLRVFGLR